MRIPSHIVSPERSRTRRLVRSRDMSGLHSDNDNRPNNFQDIIEIETVRHSSDAAPGHELWMAHSSAYVAQFIHQELLPDGRSLNRSRDAAQKYEQANQNLQPGHRAAKISV